jgi:hypothetical protein
MTKAKVQTLDELIAESKGKAAKNDALGESAAKALESTERPATVDTPVEIDVDFDFTSYDPTAMAPYFADAGVDMDPSKSYRWISTDRRRIDRRLHAGWKAINAVRHGDLVAAEIPTERLDKIRSQVKARDERLKNAHVDGLKAQARSMGFEPFDGDESLRAGLD